MYIAFTEEQAQEIRKSGISVIQFKNIIRKMYNFFSYALPELIDKVIKAIKIAMKMIEEVTDNIRIFIETVRDSLGYPTCRRYKFVKRLEKLGYDKRTMWRVTQHTWLARSNI